MIQECSFGPSEVAAVSAQVNFEAVEVVVGVVDSEGGVEGVLLEGEAQGDRKQAEKEGQAINNPILVAHSPKYNCKYLLSLPY